MSFAHLGLTSTLLKAIAKEGYSEAYPIQQQAIPAVLKGKDVLGIAQTGSGKTASFVLPILQQFQIKPPAANRVVKALILVPTRELAVQVGEVFKLFADAVPRKVKVLSVFGGVSINTQMINLQGVEILVATPGRLLDLVDAKAMDLSSIDILVLDEADKMLNMGFKAEMDNILKLLPSKRQNLLFSATLGKEIHTITEILLHNPVKIQVEEEKKDIDLITQTCYHVTEERKGPLLRYLIKQHQINQVLVFASSIHRADAVVEKLKKHGIDAASMHSKKSQGARTDALGNFKNGKLKVLVATDLASRGIDIQFLPWVINYELPRSPKDYIHRIGRTGRAANAGNAISMVSEEEEHHFSIIQKKMGKKVDIIDTSALDLSEY
ncbi:MAG: DEAD/DEAH box helicase [Chitinophagaceae bacterium]|nr:DEAD/DEAH box helicase [Chitinophagaceae bacterium]